MSVDSPDLDYSYTAFQQSQGDNSFPGTQLDNDLANLKAAIDAMILLVDPLERVVLMPAGELSQTMPPLADREGGALLGFDVDGDLVALDFEAPDNVILATQQQAEEGINNTAMMTALRVRQALEDYFPFLMVNAEADGGFGDDAACNVTTNSSRITSPSNRFLNPLRGEIAKVGHGIQVAGLGVAGALYSGTITAIGPLGAYADVTPPCSTTGAGKKAQWGTDDTEIYNETAESIRASGGVMIAPLGFSMVRSADLTEMVSVRLAGVVAGINNVGATGGLGSCLVPIDDEFAIVDATGSIGFDVVDLQIGSTLSPVIARSGLLLASSETHQSNRTLLSNVNITGRWLAPPLYVYGNVDSKFTNIGVSNYDGTTMAAYFGRDNFYELESAYADIKVADGTVNCGNIGIDSSGFSDRDPDSAAATAGAAIWLRGANVRLTGANLDSATSTNGAVLADEVDGTGCAIALFDCTIYTETPAFLPKYALRAATGTLSVEDFRTEYNYGTARTDGDVQFDNGMIGAVSIESDAPQALAVGRQGAENPALNVNASVPLCITGIGIEAQAAGGGVDIFARGETNVTLRINAAGSGQIILGGTSTGGIVLARSTTIAGTLIITSNNAAAFAIGRQGSTLPAFQVDASIASSITGVKITAQASAGGVKLAAVGEASVPLLLDGAGTGAVIIGSFSTGDIILGRPATIAGSLVITAQNANALTVGRQGAASSAFNVNTSTANCITGLDLTSNSAGNGVALTATGETNVSVRFDAAGSGTITLNSVGTGNIILGRTTTIAGTLTITAADANAFAVGRQGASVPALNVNTSSANCITGFDITAGATGAGVGLTAIGETNVSIRFDAAGTGTITLNGTATGNIILGRTTTIAGTLTITSAGASAFAVGRLGAITPALVVDASAATSITGFKITAAAASGGLALAAVGETNINVTLDAAGSGTLTLNGTATGNITTPRITTFTNATDASAVGTAAVVLTGGLSVAKNIRSGALISALGTSGYYFGTTQILYSYATNYTRLSDNEGRIGILVGNSSDKSTFIDNDTIIFRKADATASFTISNFNKQFKPETNNEWVLGTAEPKAWAAIYSYLLNLLGDRGILATNQTSAAAASSGTLTNAPAAGNPGFWWKVSINGTNYAIPCWAG